MPDAAPQYRSISCIAKHKDGSKVWLVRELNSDVWSVLLVYPDKESKLLEARFRETFQPAEYGRVLIAQRGPLTQEQQYIISQKSFLGFLGLRGNWRALRMADDELNYLNKHTNPRAIG